MKKRDVVSMLDVEDILDELLRLAEREKRGENLAKEPLRNRTLAMIFEKSSTRTRVSFEAGMTRLGGHAICLNPKDMQMGRGETVADTARTLSRYVDAIMYRAYSHKMVQELAQHATVPVINALSDVEHPCQILADLLTIQEHKRKLKGVKLVYVGDGNNVCNSLMLGAAMSGMHFIAACPKGYWPDDKITRKAKSLSKKYGGSVHVAIDPKTAVKGSDVIYTDVWVSMGQEEEQKQREKIFEPYQLNSSLLSKAKKSCIVMHCLPAHRGLEITDEVIDGPQSVVFDQAENRMWAQNALLLKLLT